MLVKPSDSKQSDIDELLALKSRPSTPPSTQQQIEQEIRKIKAGIKGEAEAAYEMSVYFGHANFAVLHDIRLEHDGITAQIDHLIIGRLLDIWVCESKHFSEGVAINEYGEFCAFYAGKPYGVGSPIAQNEKHILMLQRLLKAKKIVMPTRLGVTISPVFHSLILVSKGARIQRPNKNLPELACVIKNDMLASTCSAQSETSSVLKVISQDSLANFAHSIAALHTPIKINWEAKFGLAALETAAPLADGPLCRTCGTKVTPAVAQFCLSNKARFHGEIYCQLHQGPSPLSRSNTSSVIQAKCATCNAVLSSAEAKFCANHKDKFGNKVYCRKHQ